jgi:hypothetical protein
VGEAIAHARLNDLPLVVRSYVKNLHAQYQEILKRDFGVESWRDITAEMQRKFTHEQKMQQRKLIELLARMTEANQKKAIPERDRASFETFERLFELSEQYATQLNLLKKAKLVETREDGAAYMRAIDGQDYPVPTLEDITIRILERQEFFETKADQKFVKLLLVPFGMPLDDLIARFKQYLLDYKNAHPGFDLDKTEPVWMWEAGYGSADVTGFLVYDPKSFDRDHQGKTKAQILETGDAWRILFLQSARGNKGFRGIPRGGKGTTEGTATPRPDIETGKTPIQYLFSAPEGEHGMTPEEWMLLFMAHLEETGEPIDDFVNGTDSAAYLTGAYFVGSGDVPDARWYRDNRRAYLYLVRSVPRSLVPDLGVRGAVRV